VTPGTGYLEALCEPNVSVITDPIRRVEEKGIVTANGTFHELDVLVCATGFDVSNRPRFPIVGRAGHTFTDKWAASPKGYMSVAMAGMPNYFGLWLCVIGSTA
jgi:cation diffusion facilitator CzcD-associated flavoprotein CzcO